MPDFKAMYYGLFNSVTDAMDILREAQQRSEEAFLNADDTADLPED